MDMRILELFKLTMRLHFGFLIVPSKQHLSFGNKIIACSTLHTCLRKQISPYGPPWEQPRGDVHHGSANVCPALLEPSQLWLFHMASLLWPVRSPAGFKLH